VGDRALIAIADVLRDNTCHDAAVARIGGEEFMIAELVADAGMCKQQAERVRSAIAFTVFGTTASVDVASIPLRQASVLDRDVIDGPIKIR